MKKIIVVLLMVILTPLITACNKAREYVAKIDNTDTALLSIFTFDGKSESSFGLMNLGHSFLTIENISSEPIDICNKTIHSGETICVGTWSIRDHFGVWYNVESNYITEHNKYDGRVSVTIGIGSDDIDTISDFIYKSDNWNPLHNCSYFAINLWNNIASNTEKLDIGGLFYTPAKLKSEIIKFPNYEINREIITDTDFGYFNDTTYVSHTWYEEVAV